MQIEKLIHALSHHVGPFPRGPVLEAIRRQDEITPHLLEMLEYTDRLANEGDWPEDYMGHIMACYLLAQFREQRAYRPIVALFSPTRKLIDRNFGDFTTENLPSVLASTFDGDWEPLTRMFMDNETDQYVRGSALQALTVLVAQSVLERDEVMAYFINLLEGGLEGQPIHAWTDVVYCASELHPGEAMDQIREAFAHDKIDTSVYGPEWVERQNAMSLQAAMAKLAKDPYRQFITDTIDEFSGWAWFTNEDYWPESARKNKGYKPGRNDPCPCGSGLKFKYCCGKRRASSN